MGLSTDRPVARTHDVVLKTAGEEVLVYDLTRHRAHSLNAAAAAVWRQCDGTLDAVAIAAALRGRGGSAVTVETVRYALAELGRAHLLVAPVAGPAMTRRQLVQRLGTAAVVVLPLVTSITVPTAAQAQSVSPACNLIPPSDSTTAVCTSSEQCCPPGLCVNTAEFQKCCIPGGSACQNRDQCCGSADFPSVACTGGICGNLPP